ncbi:hypothetical protein M422DRAFT_265282 [Sphaerobolus stellatus SS14]|uniref:BTB domain-containing protein n=1 Tax=Sphaerobolus stellatus (strain SS14) TaxID=990650 RepID=A0A0C9UDL4_SPHS4|nr:hypothetical protein M422DRAFT_265282 [Sphaerobolus stellatus SS14]
MDQDGKPSTTTPQDPQEWTRHPNLYYEDGTIVLLAKATLFRVYYGILSRECEVFRGTSQLLEDRETHDGCPLVRLEDDPELLAYFLQTLMGQIEILDSNENVENEAPDRALGILLFSHKYLAARYRKKAVKWFEDRIPENIKEIDLTMAWDSLPWPRWTHASLLSTEEPNPIAIFQECDLYRFLPMVEEERRCLDSLGIVSPDLGR